MNRATLFLLGSLLFLLNCSVARGQGCGTTLVPHFSVYSSISRDGKNIFTSVSIQGYASVYPKPGCQMNRATHHVGAENNLNNVDHWTYSANGCPTCYFSATDNELLAGVPGVEYPYSWDGQAICNIVGPFFNNGGSGNILGCLVPTTETTTDRGFNGVTSREQFDMTISDTDGDIFDGYYLKEVTTSPGTNTCWWSGSRLPQNPGLIIHNGRLEPSGECRNRTTGGSIPLGGT